MKLLSVLSTLMFAMFVVAGPAKEADGKLEKRQV
jgi:hypothetical protein